MKKPVIAIWSVLAGMVLGAGSVGKLVGDSLCKERSKADKHFALFLLMNQWVKIKQEGKSPAWYFEKHGYKKIAVYGMSYAGMTLVHELKDSGITVAYGIDKKAGTMDTGLRTVSLEDELEDVDAVVVTAITFFYEIEETLSAKMKCPVISLEDILFGI